MALPVISSVSYPGSFTVSGSTSSTFVVETQRFDFSIRRQNYFDHTSIDDWVFDPMVAVNAPLTTVSGTATNNRLVVYGTVSRSVDLISSVNLSSVVVPQYFSTTGFTNSLYTEGDGRVTTTQPLLIIRPATSLDVKSTFDSKFMFFLEQEKGLYGSASIKDADLITRVAILLKKKIVMDLNTILLSV